MIDLRQDGAATPAIDMVAGQVLPAGEQGELLLYQSIRRNGASRAAVAPRNPGGRLPFRYPVPTPEG